MDSETALGQHVTYKDYSQCSPNFINGIEFLKRGMMPQANRCFEMAYEQVSYSHVYHNKYASFCGFSRVKLGDRGGLLLCRDAARDELYDGDVFYNLAQSEWHFQNRKRTVGVLIEGLNVDNVHPGMRKFRERLGVRKNKPIAFLSRNHMLNNKLGKLFRKR